MTVPRAKKSKSENLPITRREVEQIKKNLSREITNKAVMLTICATVDELKLSEEKVMRIVKRTERYADNLDKNLVRINDLGKSIKASTGIDWGQF